MSEPFLERLSRFTPDAGTLDRDALLFAAGRCSARPDRGWISLASLLAATQVLSLVLLWPHPSSTAPASKLIVAAEPPTTLPTALAPRPLETSSGASLWSARHSLPQSDAADRAMANVNFVDSGPPLRASGSIPPSLLN